VPHAVAHRIGLIGGECTGKSTLAVDLAAELGRQLGVAVPVVGEVLRSFVAANGRAPHRGEQAGILAEQRAAEDAAAQRASLAGSGALICDPATIMTAVYSGLYFTDSSLMAEALHQARDYAVLLWCRPDIPWVAEDGQRDGPQFRQRADDSIADVVVRSLAPRGLRVYSVSGTRQERLDIAVAHAMALLNPSGAWREGQPSRGT
jgi:nicotinamide riboside kinase